MKIAMHYATAAARARLQCTPETIDRIVSEEETACMRALIGDRMPALSAGTVVDTATCMYTMTPDEHFLLDWHPQHADKVFLVSPCSGHGFKFCSVVGEIVADMLTVGETNHDISLFSFASRQSSSTALH